MCIRDRANRRLDRKHPGAAADELLQDVVLRGAPQLLQVVACLLYTSDAADERSSVDLGGRRIIKKKNSVKRLLTNHRLIPYTTILIRPTFSKPTHSTPN